VSLAIISVLKLHNALILTLGDLSFVEMISRQLLRFSITGRRNFSSSTSMAAEVRRLGVVGAGQMVCLQ